jgi:1,2-diacylglycerol 3-beta-galactosyltransferase
VMDSAVRVLILTADYGRGHRSAAQALAAAFAQCYRGSVQATVINPLRQPGSSSLPRYAERWYRTVLHATPWLYDLLYRLADRPSVSRWLARGTLGILHDTIRATLLAHPAEVVIGVFPGYTAAVARLYQGSPYRPGLLTVVTDLGPPHQLWFAATDDYCLVATQTAYDHALGSGMDPRRVRVTGVPIHPAFGVASTYCDAVPAGSATCPTILLLGGGAGVGQLERVAIALDRACLSLRLVVVAGTNTVLEHRLRRHPWRGHVRIYGFVPLLADLIHAADIVVTRAGGLTISEALALGKPILIHGRCPGQEQGNLAYVCLHGAGLHTPTPDALLAAVRRWIENPAERQRYAAMAQRLGRPTAAREIARLAWELSAGTRHAAQNQR